ncbi:MAG: response regulator transcription factor [Saprospiraceae bacterium]|nr:response regulator transcription factor [Saprospiraceae bacterium]
MNKSKILLAEDDETLAFVTADNLNAKGYNVILVNNGVEAVKAFELEKLDLCILDVMMPEKDGFEAAREIRAKSKEVPILFLTAKSMKEDRIEGLSLGADDYITKPFSIEELVLRIEIFLRRRFVDPNRTSGIINLGQYSFDPENYQITGPDGKQDMTQREAELLLYFFKHKNQLSKRSDILIAVWGKDDYFLGRSMDVFVSRLRKFFEKDPSIKIENVHGVGYRFTAAE